MTVLNFQGLGGDRAAINGDFVTTAEETDAVLTALRDADTAVQSTHQHMLADEPRIIYSRFWATGDAARLAEGLRAALDEVDAAPPDGRLAEGC